MVTKCAATNEKNRSSRSKQNREMCIMCIMYIVEGQRDHISSKEHGSIKITILRGVLKEINVP